jgi:hypothetical protein
MAAQPVNVTAALSIHATAYTERTTRLNPFSEPRLSAFRSATQRPRGALVEFARNAYWSRSLAIFFHTLAL